ncbi:MAG: ribosome silencing factor [Planctomycetales bacterium]|nr:ribosome silencing factor [Planctomycetales bacterium]
MAVCLLGDVPISSSTRPSLIVNSPPQPPAPITPALEARRRISLENACQIAKICAEFRGKDTVVLDLTAITPVFDYFVITTCTNPRTLAAIAIEARVQMKARGNAVPLAEGEKVSSWLLQDWGDIVAHLMLAEARELYDLEGLWADAKRIDWQSIAGAPVLASAR